MDMDLAPEHVAFVEEVRDFLAEMPPDLAAGARNAHYFDHEQTMAWHHILYEKGWAAPHWPEEHGGTGWDITRRFLFSERVDKAARCVHGLRK